MNYCIHTYIVRQVDVRVDDCVIADTDARHDAYLDTGAAIVTDEGAQFITTGINHYIAEF